MKVTTVGLDLAKNVFQVHGIADEGAIAFNRSLRRSQVLAFFERLEPCLVGLEACASGHYWARELSRIGHEVRLIPAMYVKPYVKRGKSDAVDAEAICEAVTRPTMRFVEIKSEEQQALLSLHRARDFVVRQRTQLINMNRPEFAGGLLSLVTPRRHRLPEPLSILFRGLRVGFSRWARLETRRLGC
ncbi:transposase IS116/IS110/IS902 family protein [Roseivivax marinus]|uniref:Transposase IS116/IS110/IS902 family protein n=1 Tax=Roseivivax marinus TaxID=1379903 RepID=W4HDD6_9RHOB|nr:transposase IS116/IS110/IS902 family protein [Roseivivax marinus]